MDQAPDPALISCAGLTRKAVLQPLARDVVEQPKRAYERWGQDHPRPLDALAGRNLVALAPRVVIKVEVSDPGVHTRFVVTDMEELAPRALPVH